MHYLAGQSLGVERATSASQPDELLVLTNFVADQRASSGPADGAQRTAKHGIADQAACNSANASADLRVGWAGATTRQDQQCSSSNRDQNF